jgi:hypothetical protein
MSIKREAVDRNSDGASPSSNPPPPRLNEERVWRDLTRASFAVISYVTPAGSPRSSGVVYAVADRRMYVAVAENSWKAKYIAVSGQVSVTVPVRRGGVMTLVFPIPPATITFHASAIVHPADSLTDRPLPKRLASLVPPERRTGSCIIEIEPTGVFITYGVGVSLRQMRSPASAGERVRVG